MNEVDVDLVARALAGDTDAFAALFERHRGRVGRVCCSYVGKADAEDLVQAAFVTAPSGCRNAATETGSGPGCMPSRVVPA